MEYTHQPVLLTECIEGLAIRPEGVYVDGTLGRAGHSREIAKRLTTGRLLCIDRDQAAIDAGAAKLSVDASAITAMLKENPELLRQVLQSVQLPPAEGGEN